MLKFLQKQRENVLKELTSLYEQRRNAGVESIGGIKNRIVNVKEELKELDAEIAELATQKISKNPPKENPIDVKAKVITLVAEGEIEEAIELTTKTWDKTELILLSSRFNQLKSSHSNGVLSYDDYKVENARITSSLLETLKKL